MSSLDICLYLAKKITDGILHGSLSLRDVQVWINFIKNKSFVSPAKDILFVFHFFFLYFFFGKKIYKCVQNKIIIINASNVFFIFHLVCWICCFCCRCLEYRIYLLYLIFLCCYFSYRACEFYFSDNNILLCTEE